MQGAGKVLVLAGVVLVIVGALLMFSDRIPLLGKLPGDIIIKRENFQIVLPLATSLLLSVLLNVLMWAVLQVRGK
jgi:hypothetical protein